MRNIILFDDDKVRAALLPLTFTRPVAEIRFGIMTQTQKWQKAIEGRYSYLTQDYLSEKYPAVMAEDNLFVAAHVCPDGALVAAIEALGADEALVTPAGEMLARRGLADKKTVYDGEFLAFREVTDLFMLNDKAIRADYAVLVAGRKSAPSRTAAASWATPRSSSSRRAPQSSAPTSTWPRVPSTSVATPR